MTPGETLGEIVGAHDDGTLIEKGDGRMTDKDRAVLMYALGVAIEHEDDAETKAVLVSLEQRVAERKVT